MSENSIVQDALDPQRRKDLKAKGWRKHNLLILDMDEPMSPMLKRLAEDHAVPRYGVQERQSK